MADEWLGQALLGKRQNGEVQPERMQLISSTTKGADVRPHTVTFEEHVSVFSA